MRIFIFTFLSILLAGCGVIECVDAQFERKPIPIDEKFEFQLVLPNSAAQSVSVKCEKFYDSMCAERGNSWRIRQVGLSSSHKSSSFIIKNDGVDIYELELPNCEKLIRTNGSIDLTDTRIVWGRDKVKVEKLGESGTTTSWLGKSFHYVETNGTVHKYKHGGYRDTPLEILELEFILTLNNQKIDN